jgi:conjugative relaxase-like TrwC/TraI family protein
MVAHIVARGSAKAALAYYDHLRGEDYDTRIGGEPPGRWAGKGADRLSMHGPVTQTEFRAALDGFDPKTGERLARFGPRRPHYAGWDMIFSAPKSVSVLWALSNEPERQAIEHAHRSAVLIATAHLERSWAWTNAGTPRERTAGLLMAEFDHHTSHASDPHLHTHSFIFNVAPRWDGGWGTIAGREFYRAQKNAGAIYRRALANELERLDYRLDHGHQIFRVAAIPRDIDRAFSKRQQEIQAAAHAYDYQTAKVMALANLRTRRTKRETKVDRLFEAWKAEAKALGFELSPKRRHALPSMAAAELSHLGPTPSWFSSTTRSGQSIAPAASAQQSAAPLGSQIGQALRSLDQPSSMSGIKVRIRESNRELERE